MDHRCYFVALVVTLGFGLTSAEGQSDPKDSSIAPELIKQLGDKDYAIREMASERLAKMGPKALALLRQAQRSGDLEIRSRASRILERIEPPGESISRLRSLLWDLQRSPRLTTERIRAMYLVSRCRPPRAQECRQGKEILAQAPRSRSAVDLWFDSLLYHIETRKEVPEALAHIHRIGEAYRQQQQDLKNRKSISGLVLLNGEFQKKHIEAASTKLLACRQLTADQQMDIVFVLTWHRFPSDEEKAYVAKHRKKTKDGSQFLRDILGALVNSREFVDRYR